MSGKLVPFEKYKDSGSEWLGAVPSEWAVARFKGLLRERNELSVLGDETLLSVSAYTGVTPREDIIEADDILVRADTLVGYKRCEPTDLVVNTMLAWNRGLGVSRFSGIVSPAYAVYKLSEAFHPDYLHYLVRTDFFILYFKAFSTGVIDSRLRLYPDMFFSLYTMVPPLVVQKAIASYLDTQTQRIDTLIKEQQKLIELLREKRQALISHAVTKGIDPKAKMKDSGVEWMGEIPEEWEAPAIGYRYGVQLGKMLDGARIVGDNLSPYLRNTDVQWGRVNFEDLPTMDFTNEDRERFSLRNGDLLVCEGGDIGRSAVWNAPVTNCFYQKALHRIRPLDSTADSNRFLYYFFEFASRNGIFTIGVEKATIIHLTAERVRAHRFPRPPFEDQLLIARFLEQQTTKIDALISEAESTITLMQEHRSALISAVVTGKVRVPA